MPIRVACPACRRILKVPDGAAGQSTKCPACGNPVTIPSVEGATQQAGLVPRPATATRPAEGAPPRSRDDVGWAAAAAGGIALLAAFVPRIGLFVVIPLSGLALILATVDLARSAVRRAGWVSPAVGFSLGITALVVALAVHIRFSQAVDAARAATVADSSAPRPKAASDGTFAGQDRNGDGRLNADELSDDLRGRFAVVDADGDGYVSRAEWDRAKGVGNAPEKGTTIATAVFTAADDFVVDVWQNGEKVADDRRQVVGETYGATAEKLNIEVKEGDWLVFNVANNRLRWGGASYFAVAGVDDNGRPTFQSDPNDGRWSYCDDPAEVPAFIARPSYKADRAALPPAIPWHSGDGEIQSRVPDWSGKPVWGHERTTWIKYVVPAAGTWKPPGQAQATPVPDAVTPPVAR